MFKEPLSKTNNNNFFSVTISGKSSYRYTGLLISSVLTEVDVDLINRSTYGLLFKLVSV